MTQVVAIQEPADRIIDVLINGNLSTLKAPERLDYYNRVCESLSLNPLTKPFEFITLQGKLVMYATKACAEQLRQNYGISIVVNDQKQVGDMYMVTVSATDKTGRVDSDMGVVNTKGLSGENLANAILKAVTKAKRRVTLSICGLGMLDETEVADIPDSAKRQPVVMPQSRIGAPRVSQAEYTGDISPEFMAGVDEALAEEAAGATGRPIEDIRADYAWEADLKREIANSPVSWADLWQFLGVAGQPAAAKREAIDAWLNPAIGAPREPAALVKFVADRKVG